MTGARLRECLALLRWSQRELAQALGCNDRLTRRWAGDGAPIPENVADWLETLAHAHANHPPPAKWRSNPRFGGTGF